MSITRAFDFITPPPTRSLSKPRTSGLTMVIDQGLGMAAQQDGVVAQAGVDALPKILGK